MRETTGTRLLTLIAAAIALSLASSFFVPLTLGVILSAVLYPIVAALRRVHVPQPLGAALAVLVAVAALILAVTVIEPPVRALGSEIPKTLVSARGRLESLGIRLPGGGVTGNRQPSRNPPAERRVPPDSVNEPKRAPSKPPATSAPDSAASPQRGGADGSPAMGIGQTVARAFGITAAALFALIEVLLLAFFILAAGDDWQDKLQRAARSPEQQKGALATVQEIRRVVLRYLLVNVIINAAQGILVAAIVWMLGYPTPIVWGVLTFIAEFIPYFGGAAMVGLLFLTGLAGGSGIGHALLAPAAYLLITTLQNNLISPAAYGRSLRLNPTAILAGVMFWGLVWGIAGAFLAVPLLAAMRILSEKDDSLLSVSVFLSE